MPYLPGADMFNVTKNNPTNIMKVVKITLYKKYKKWVLIFDTYGA